MIPLVKVGCPDILVTDGAALSAEYVSAIEAGLEHKGYWGHAEIRSSLDDETSRRCAYCEAFIGHVAYVNVEHILPKAKFPLLAHEWDNLTAACPRCNTNKGSYHVDGLTVVNPYVDNPSDHVRFFGNFVVTAPGSGRGKTRSSS